MWDFRSGFYLPTSFFHKRNYDIFRATLPAISSLKLITFFKIYVFTGSIDVHMYRWTWRKHKPLKKKTQIILVLRWLWILYTEVFQTLPQVASYPAHYNLIIIIIIINKLRSFKTTMKGVLGGHTVATVTYCVTKNDNNVFNNGQFLRPWL